MKMRINFKNFNTIFFEYFLFQIFFLFLIWFCVLHIVRSQIQFFFLNQPILFCPLFFTSAMHNNTGYNIICNINFLLSFLFSSFLLKLSYFHIFQWFYVFLICSFVRFLVPYLPYISFKIKSDIISAPEPSCKFFILAQILSVFFTLKD